MKCALACSFSESSKAVIRSHLDRKIGTPYCTVERSHGGGGGCVSPGGYSTCNRSALDAVGFCRGGYPCSIATDVIQFARLTTRRCCATAQASERETWKCETVVRGIAAATMHVIRCSDRLLLTKSQCCSVSVFMLADALVWR